MARIGKKTGLPVRSAARAASEGLSGKRALQFGEGYHHAVLSNSSLIRNGSDLARLEVLEKEAVRRKYGNLFPEFGKKLEKVREDEVLDIRVNLAVENPGYVNKLKASLTEQKENALKWANLKPLVQKENVLSRYGLTETKLEKSRGNSLLFSARANKSKILQMSRDPGIASIGEKSPGVVTGIPIDFEDLLESARNEINLSSIVNVATFEFGLDPAFVSCLPSPLRPVTYDGFPAAPLYYPDWYGHSKGTYYLSAVGTPGHNHYHYNDYAEGDEWLFQNIADEMENDEINAISTSHLNGYLPIVTSPDSRMVDRLSGYIYPYPTISLPTGNEGHQFESFCQSYNALIVGNVQHLWKSSYTTNIVEYHEDGDTLEYDHPSSRTKNSTAIYGSADDREMPYLVAPGFVSDPGPSGNPLNPGPSGLYNPCVTFPDPGWAPVPRPWTPGGGTSLSAPVANAVAANVIAGLSLGTQGWSEAVRAILLVTAPDVQGGYWDPANSDQQDGAGVIAGEDAVAFTSSYTLLYPDNPSAAGETGLSMWSFDSTAFDGHTSYYYTIRTPETFPDYKHLRVVLTWSSSPGLSVDENEVSDLGLDVQSEAGYITSDAWNGNIEMVDVPIGDINTSSEYRIYVNPMTYRSASDGPTTQYFALAWTWVRDDPNY